MLARNAMPETDCFDAGAALTKTQEWKTYRTRFLVRARQLNEPAVVIDASGREQVGTPGDYLVECSDGSRRIAPRQIFEDVYVEMEKDEVAASAAIERLARRDRSTPQRPLFGVAG
jgi:hypothetical protein